MTPISRSERASRARRQALLPALLLALAALAGCSDGAEVRSERVEYLPGGTPVVRRELAVPRCPEVGILGEAADVTRFRPGPGRDLTDVTLDARITGVEGSCTARRGRMEIELAMSIDATRGPAAAARADQLSYFVAVTDQQRNILNKQVFQTAVRFPSGQNRATLMDEGARLTLAVSPERPSWSYTILVGFQLDEGELAYNRRRGTR